MPDQQSRSPIRVRNAVATALEVSLALIISATFVAGCSSTIQSSSSSGAQTIVNGPVSEQVLIQGTIVSDRKHLFNGVLTYVHLSPMPVDNTQELDVTLIAVGQNGDVPIPPFNVIGSRSLQVGGVEDATLSDRGGGVQISPVGSTRRLIGQPGDTAHWAWDITPMQPGEYTLELVVVTYQGTTDNPLSIINPPVDIALNVTDTWSHRLDSVKGWIIGLGAFFAAVAIIFTFFREQVFGLLPKRKKKAKEQKEQSAPTP
jgi:hypothetical protein